MSDLEGGRHTIGVLSGICHAQNTLLGVLQLEILIGKLFAIDRLAASTVTLSEVASLNHEVYDDTVEG